MPEKEARKDLAEVCRLSYIRGYVCGLEGNFSIRLQENLVLSTPSGICKGRVEPEDLILTNLEGTLCSRANGRCSTELAMHLTAYAARPDISAIAHAHPPVAVGFTVAGMPLTSCVLPEVVCSLGAIPTAPYATPSTPEVSESIKELVLEYDALLLDHHGALTLGTTIWDAFYKLETLEHYAKTMLVAHQLGGSIPLCATQVHKLLAIRAVYGLTRPLSPAVLSSAAEKAPKEGANSE